MINTKVWDQWQEGKQYQGSMGFKDIFPKCVDFKEGRQWPAPTKETKNMPRPVFNICNKIVSTKRANILNQQIKMVYSPSEVGGDAFDEEGSKLFTAYAERLWKDLKQDDLNELCVDDSATLGTGILHYFWDPSVVGGKKYKYAGAIRGESLDPLCVVFGNPMEEDVQEQPYIIIGSKMLIRDVKKLAEAEGLPPEIIDNICPDNEDPDNYYATKKDQNRDKYCTLLTKYYKDGGVKFSKSTKNATIIEDRPLSPEIINVIDNDGEDAGEIEQENPEGRTFDVYPIAVMPWVRRKRSIYGIGEVESVMDAQKAINWLNAMNLLSAQNTAWPKYIQKPNAIKQQITNDPGQVLTDYSTNGQGLSLLQGAGISAGAISLSDKFNSMVQYCTGVSEVVSGEPFTSTMAASAIIALQNQAKVPIENVQKRFYRCIEQVGRIWEQFFKLYYDFPLPIIIETETGDEQTAIFKGSIYADVQMDLDIDVGAGSEYSESLAQATLDKLFDAGQIDITDYVELCPKNVMPFKEELKRKIEQRQTQMMMGMNQDLPQTAPMQEQQPQGRSPLGVELPPIPQAEGYNNGMPQMQDNR